MNQQANKPKILHFLSNPFKYFFFLSFLKMSKQYVEYIYKERDKRPRETKK